MKSTSFSILIFLSVINLSYGQTDSLNSNSSKENSKKTDSINRLYWGIHAGTLSSIYITEKLNFFAGVSAEKKRNFLALDLFVSPVKDYTDNVNGDEQKRYSLNGLNLIYQFSPNYKRKIFNIFFQYQCVSRYFKQQGNAHRYSYVILEPYHAYYYSVENDLSIGFKIKFSKYLSFTTSIGAGYGFENTLIDYKHFKDKRLYTEGLTIIANACMGYKFIRKKK